MTREKKCKENPYDVSLSEIDMSNPALFEQNVAPQYFERLRKEAPVHFSTGSECGPFWSITKYKDILEVDKNLSLIHI